MGKPKDATAAQVGTNYNWGEFGSADAKGTTLSGIAGDTVSDTQGGINKYVNELINPSYNSESFKARQDILDASNNQYAKEAGASAIDRGARGSVTQNLLNSITANRNNNMRTAMTDEDSRVRNILSSLSGVENNYFNQSNTMASNILSRIMGNSANQQATNMANTKARNDWANGLWETGASLGGTLLGGLI